MSQRQDALTASERNRIRACAEHAERSGRTRWLGRVGPAAVSDMLACYAAAGHRERFYWSRGDDALVAWGAVDEIETRGAGRFRDVAAWSSELSARIDWLGERRAAEAPLLLGGFAFEPDGPSSAHWKAFPAARFVLPAVLIERAAGRVQRVDLIRVEPGTSAAAIEASLLAQLRETPDVSATPGASQAGGSDGRSVDRLAGAALAARVDVTGAAAVAEGPEYRVRADRAHWVFEAQVADALEEIEAGRLEKVVLARSLAVGHDGLLAVAPFLARLGAIYSSCTLVAMGRGRDDFLAATPETLVRVRGRSVETAALAGSAPRGRHPEEDERFGEALLASEKERAEHTHVVAALESALEGRCESIQIAPEPRLRRLFGIQHLETSIRGRLLGDPGGAGIGVLELVEELHPTPAVGGVPRAAALAWQRRCEGLDRGWYAAPIGWLDLAGGGDFSVALRSALISADEAGAGSRALLFAGAGLVAGSEPTRELAETRIKLRALLAPLTEI